MTIANEELEAAIKRRETAVRKLERLTAHISRKSSHRHLHRDNVD